MKQLLKRILPEALVHYHQSRGLVRKAGRTIHKAEPESDLVPVLCPAGCVAIDVGSHNGAYAEHMRRHASKVYVFEPQPVLARRLAAAYWMRRNVQVRQIALSDRDGTAELRIPLIGGRPASGLATIGAQNELGHAPVQTVSVQARPLDGLGLHDVGFIKIDVEGHEHAVLMGARGLLERERPNLLIESEERHFTGAVPRLRAILEPLGYHGLFLHRGTLQPIAGFDRAAHQPDAAITGGSKHPSMTYINNFIFVQDAGQFTAAAEPLLRNRRSHTH